MRRFSKGPGDPMICFDGSPLIHIQDIRLGDPVDGYERKERLAILMVEALNRIDDFPSRKELESGEHG